MYILSLLVVVGLVIAMVVDHYNPRPVLNHKQTYLRRLHNTILGRTVRFCL